jgi:hypothetical protein
MKSRMTLSSTIPACLLIFAAQSLINNASAQSKDACSLVDAADVAAVLGEPVQAPQTESRAAKTAQSSTCRFLTPQAPFKSLSVVVQFVSDATALHMSDRLKQLAATNIEPVSGVGDDAAWGSMTFAGKTICQLSARKGKSMLLLLILGGMTDDAETLGRVKILAAKILSNT